MAGWEATPKHSFGYHRMEILGAFLSVQLIWSITGIIVYEAVVRYVFFSHLRCPFEPEMLIWFREHMDRRLVVGNRGASQYVW